jgi:hypothetical protein
MNQFLIKHMFPKIPLDVIVLVAEKCVKKNFKTALIFAILCKKLYYKPYIKKEYFKAKRTLVKNFLDKIRYWAMYDCEVDSYIILNINDIERKMNYRKIRGEQNKTLHIFMANGTFYKHILISMKEVGALEPFLYISIGNGEYKPIKKFSWTEWGGLVKINIAY